MKIINKTVAYVSIFFAISSPVWSNIVKPSSNFGCLINQLDENSNPNSGRSMIKIVFSNVVYNDTIKTGFTFDSHSRNPDVAKQSLAGAWERRDDSTFFIVFPEQNTIKKLEGLYFSTKSKSYQYSNFLVAPGDSTNLHISFGEINEQPVMKFSGKGAAKYNCRLRIETEFLDSEVRVKNAIGGNMDQRQWKDYLVVKVINLYKQRKYRMLNILDSYKPELSELEFSVLKADILASDLKLVQTIFQLWERNQNISTNILLSEYDSLVKQSVPQFKNIIKLSPEYVNYLTNLYALGCIFQNGKENVSWKEVYSSLKNEFNGELQSGIIYNLIMVNAPLINYPYLSFAKLAPADKLEYIKDGISTSIDPDVHSNLVAFKMQYTKGKEAFQFSFQNIKGENISLKDFKGKIVLMDLWFTGCGGCAIYAQIIKRFVKPSFKGNADLIYVSIGIDKKKNDWMKSVNSEIYSSLDDVNLYAEDGVERKLLTSYYGVTSYPFVLLIDRNGKVLHSISNYDPDFIIKSITEAIHK